MDWQLVVRIIWFFVQIGFLIALLYFILRIALILVSFRWGIEVPFVPTPKKIVDRMLEELNLEEGSKIVDLGSGEGSVVNRVAAKGNFDVYGIEWSRALYILSRVKSALTRKKGQVTLLRGDMYKFDLKRFDVVFMFLLPDVVSRLRPKLEESLAIGAKVVSYIYPLKSSSFKERKIEMEGCKPFFVYTKIR